MKAEGPHAKVAELERLLTDIMQRSFTKKKRKRKSTEPSWMTEKIWQWIVRRRLLFKRCGRNVAWKRMKRKTARAIKRRKTGYATHLREKFVNNTASGGFHHCVKSILNGNNAQKWKVGDMYPGMSDEAVAEMLATYFNGISSKYEPLSEEEIPKTFSEELPRVTREDGITQIKKAKKPSSQVLGDIHPSIYADSAAYIAIPVVEIFNSISETCEWLRPWKTEYVTIILKNRSPDVPEKCRNISCTPFLSKLYERFVLEWLRRKISPSPNQYGGEVSFSTAHLLVELLDEITSRLEDRRAACVLTGVDYSKAFNRLKHGPCLKAFAERGASSKMLCLLASFLKGREMTVRVGNIWSRKQTVNAGAPRGRY